MKGNVLPRVLITDHSTAVIDRLIASINDVAEVIGQATNADDAMAGIRTGCPHLVILDIALENGLDLLKAIKRQQPPIIVVILTHSVEATTRNYCRRLGAEYFLDKLSEFDKVRDIVLALRCGRHPAA